MCHIRPESGYSLGKKIYGIKGGVPPTSKIYPWIKKLKNGGYLEETKEGLSARIEPLIQQIKNKIQSGTLYKDEETKLVNLLNSKEFKEYILGWYERDKKFGNFGWSGVIVGHKEVQLNAVKLIAETIGMLCTVSIIKQEFSKIPLEEDEQKMEKYYRAKNEPESWIQEQMNGIRQYNAVVVHLKKFSDDLLSKLSKLWPASEIIIRTEVARFKQKYRG